MFKVISEFKPIEEQQKAVAQLSQGVKQGLKNQVLLGVTGSGKTFTIAHTIEKTQLPTLVISHNKTLAGQLYQEMRQFFPHNAVSYFVSYYDYYQPEAYIPQTDTYIEKGAQINETIDKLRLQSTTNILTRGDVIVVASVSCIYNIGSPREYGRFILELSIGQQIDRKKIFSRMVELQYERAEFDFTRGTFRERGNTVDIYPAYEDFGIRIILENEKIEKIRSFDPLTGESLKNDSIPQKFILYPAKHYLTDPAVFKKAENVIRADLEKEAYELRRQKKLFEAERLIKKINYDLEMIKEVGYVNGIENYSRYFDGRTIGDPPFTLLDYFQERYGKNWLVCVDESHMTIPQLRGMFNGDHARKKTLIDFGFRLRSALDNRPLRFEEFYSHIPSAIYISATPNEWEIGKLKIPHSGLVEQLVRPTGIIDPKITIKPAGNEIPDLLKEIKKRVSKKQRVLVTTLTKRNAEDLAVFLKEKNVKAEYLHSDIKTLDRSDILTSLRKKNFDVLIGINLLREGLDLPEVSLVIILDADKEGFLRSRTSLVQTMGRAARHIDGEVILYAHTMTKSMKMAIEEVERRREYQKQYNIKHQITPYSVLKPIRETIASQEGTGEIWDSEKIPNVEYIEKSKFESLTPYDKK
ncbi:MAG TPA: excinuclease ABC subunit UvrB, partial [Patescibacteria group bacterium]|nr:excinuclease ABC subunit UvrB [Patescibacteria group bacterium]